MTIYKKRGVLFFYALIALAISSCKKQGPPGPQGTAGSSNVTTRTYDITSWNSTTVPYKHYYVQLSFPEITSAVNNAAAIMTYVNTGGGVWTAVPFTEYDSPSDYHMGFKTDVGLVELTWVYDGIGYGSDPNAHYSFALQGKVVVIPPSALAAHPEVDIKNYEQVKNTFGLQD